MGVIDNRVMLEALRKAEAGVVSFHDFIEQHAPRMLPLPRHERRLVELIQESRTREVYCTVTMPPRFGKSTIMSLGLAWRILCDPACLNFYCTYGDSLAKQWSRKIRAMVQGIGVPLDKSAQDVHEWLTPWEGGLKATSVGGPIHGRGCNGGLMIGDDLLKGREKAESQNERDRVWDYLRVDMFSRLEPGASVFLINVHWHHDDHIARVRAPEGGPDWDPHLGVTWENINYAAVIDADGEAADERITPENAFPLWPEGGYDLDKCRQIRARGELDWWSVYQQRPTPLGGGMWKDAWWDGRIVSPSEAPKNIRWIRAWDPAGSTTDDSPWTVDGLVGLHEGRIWLNAINRDRIPAGQVEDLVAKRAHEDFATWKRKIPVDFPQDPGQAGKAQISYIAKKLHGFTFWHSPESGDKVTRFYPVANQGSAGNVFMVDGPWVKEVRAELAMFPNGKYKDIADMISRGYASHLAHPPQVLGGAPRLLGGEGGLRG